MRHIAAGLSLLLLPLTAAAHHSFGPIFDSGRTIELEGEITRVVWRNPHVRLGVRTADGETWELESNSVSILRRMEITSDIVAVGDAVRVAGNPARSGDNRMFVLHVMLPSEREVVLRPNTAPRWTDEGIGTSATWSAQSGTAAPDAGIFRVWSTSFGSPGSFPFHPPGNPRPLANADYPLTERARAALERFDRAADDPTLGCAPKGMPEIVSTPYPQAFVDEGDRILHRIEEYDTVRTIHMRNAPSSEDVAPSRLGHSVGRWEGDTLVVRTTKVDWGHFNMSGIPLSEAAELVERFTPSEDGSRLDYRIEITDPATFTEPVVLERHWLWLPDVEVEPYECTN